MVGRMEASKEGRKDRKTDGGKAGRKEHERKDRSRERGRKEHGRKEDR